MPDLDPLFRKLEVRDALSEEEKRVLLEAAGPKEAVGQGGVIVAEGVTQSTSRLLIDGLAARSKHLPTGARQITELHVPGDFIDLHSLLLKRLDHDLVALSPVRVIAFPHDRLRRITETHPHLARLLWLVTLMDASIHREWLVSAGRRPAVEQMGHLFCELMVRYRTVGLSDGKRCPLVLTQDQLADVTGLSTVHVNRVVQELRREDLIDWRGGELTIHDFDRLAAFSKFDAAYLILDREPR